MAECSNINKEIWKPIENYSDYYISNFGNVKSFKRGKERILKAGSNKGYLFVILCNKFKNKKRTIHSLVAEEFLNHKPSGMNLVINHKDFNRQNNNVDNLEIITNRENTNLKHLKSISEYVGVTFHKQNNKWRSRIYVEGKLKHIGLFNTEIEASNAYQLKLNSLSL